MALKAEAQDSGHYNTRFHGRPKPVTLKPWQAKWDDIDVEEVSPEIVKPRRKSKPVQQKSPIPYQGTKSKRLLERGGLSIGKKLEYYAAFVKRFKEIGGKNVARAAREIGLDRRTIEDILLVYKPLYHDKVDAIEESIDNIQETCKTPKYTRHRLRPGKFHAIDETTYEWVASQKLEGVFVTGPMIKEKARETARQLGITEFTGSNGWLERFKVRSEYFQILKDKLALKNKSSSNNATESTASSNSNTNDVTTTSLESSRRNSKPTKWVRYAVEARPNKPTTRRVIAKKNQDNSTKKQKKPYKLAVKLHQRPPAAKIKNPPKQQLDAISKSPKRKTIAPKLKKQTGRRPKKSTSNNESIEDKRSQKEDSPLSIDMEIRMMQPGAMDSESWEQYQSTNGLVDDKELVVIADENITCVTFREPAVVKIENSTNTSDAAISENESQVCDEITEKRSLLPSRRTARKSISVTKSSVKSPVKKRVLSIPHSPAKPETHKKVTGVRRSTQSLWIAREQ